ITILLIPAPCSTLFPYTTLFRSVSAFGTFLLRQFFMGLPKELEEAAKLDGCNIGQTFVRVMLPLARSGLVALAIFTALFAFKDRSEEHTSELQSREKLVCRLLL